MVQMQQFRIRNASVEVSIKALLISLSPTYYTKLQISANNFLTKKKKKNSQIRVKISTRLLLVGFTICTNIQVNLYPITLVQLLFMIFMCVPFVMLQQFVNERPTYTDHKSQFVLTLTDLPFN